MPWGASTYSNGYIREPDYLCLAACSFKRCIHRCSDPLVPSDLVGLYHLVAVNDEALPITVLEGSSCTTETGTQGTYTVLMTTGTLDIPPEMVERFRLKTEFLTRCGGLDDDRQSVSGPGRYELASGRAKFFLLFVDGESFLGTGEINESTLRIDLVDGWAGYGFKSFTFVRPSDGARRSLTSS